MFTRQKNVLLLALCGAIVFAGAASAQEPIVKIDVKPAMPAFKNWSEPIVIKSAEDAAKHFDKEALEALTKKVDLKKQIVLIFSWRGSGGDKLLFTVAESFPEQIGFSLKQGLTDDLRSHVLVYALRSNVKWSIRGAKAEAPKEGDQPVAVRALKFKPADPTIAFTLGGKANADPLADAEAVEKVFGKASAKELTDQVDFTKEKIVLVSWNTSGPPDGKLQHEIKGAGKDRKLTFYVQGPPGAGARGQRLRLGFDLFAVPRDVAVAFEPKERR